MKLAALILLCALPVSASDTSARPDADGARRAAIQACASCHPKEYAAWIDGPHSHTKSDWDAHWAKTADPNSDLPADMRAFLKTVNPRDTCLPCHAPSATVYGKSLPVEWDGASRLYPRPLSLKLSDPVLSSGVDCLTCHADGKGRVVTRADYVRTPGLIPPPGFCDPVASKVFSHPMNCVTCHDTTVHAMADERAADGGKALPLQRCEECHWEKGADGRYTHYEYWRRGARGRDPIDKAAFDTLSLAVRRGAKNLELAVVWPLDFLPHPIVPNSYMWYAFRFEFLDRAGKAVYKTKFGFTNFSKDTEMRTALARFTQTGEELYSPLPRERFARTLPLPASVPGAGVVRLTVVRRTPYYGPDSGETTLYTRNVPYAQ